MKRLTFEADGRASIGLLDGEKVFDPGARLPEIAAGYETSQARMPAPLDANERRRFLEPLRKMADGNNAKSRAPMRL